MDFYANTPNYKILDCLILFRIDFRDNNDCIIYNKNFVNIWKFIERGAYVTGDIE